MKMVRLAVFGAVLAMSGCSTTGREGLTPQPAAAPATEAGAKASLYNLPLSFVENRGQVDGPVNYYVQGADTSMYFTPDGVTFALTNATAKASKEPSSSPTIDAHQRWAVKLDFVGANAVEPTGAERAQGVVSHFGGGAGNSQTAIPTYSSIAYKDLWPGIDMVYAGTGSKLKYSFVVHPGADPSGIRLAYRGARSVALNGEGQLEVTTPAGGFTDDTPYSYQDIGGRRVEVPSSYQVAPGAGAGDATVGIPVGAYDTTRDLIIDPVVLIRSGFIGGAGNDEGLDLAVDTAGNAYIAGTTNSLEDTFPVTVGPDLTGTNTDAFVAKLDPTGNLVYAGYIGGAGVDTGLAIAVDSAGSAYVTGATSSAADTFPVAVGPDLTPDAANNAYVAKVDPAGSALVYAGYISAASGQGIAVDGAGNAYVSGYAGSPENGFPVAGGGDLTFNGVSDAFVAKVEASGAGLAYAGYIGGVNFDRAFGIAVDGSGNAYVTGETQSDQTSFTVMVGPDLTYNVKRSHDPAAIGRDAFIAKVSPTGSFAYAGYIGGLASDTGVDVAVDAAGNAYVAGNTASRDFPVTRGSFDRTFGGGFFSDGFLAKVAADGSRLIYAGYIGSDTADNANSVAIDGDGAAYMTGRVGITTKFPTPGGFDTTHNGLTDAFAVRVNPAGTNLDWGTFLGGSNGDGGSGIGLDSGGDVYIVGGTSSTEATFPVSGGPDLTHNGGGDAFVAKLDQTP